APEAAGPYALQSGAFRSRDGADDLARRLRRAGFEPRLVRLRDGHLILVRIGRFTGTADAVALARRVRAAGFDALVVDDAARETPVR
ncbi:MAG: SPOR domain-containing protein, partial [Gemmatimonadetes bacterium]|nr:SPOR domain-containing protein [Gemmatimonadota bacterium]